MGDELELIPVNKEKSEVQNFKSKNKHDINKVRDN